jgi:hypothetical protein
VAALFAHFDWFKWCIRNFCKFTFRIHTTAGLCATLCAFVARVCLGARFQTLGNLKKKDGVIGEWIKLHNEELNDLYCSPQIVRVIKPRKMRWVGHVLRMREGSGVYRVAALFGHV